ncbi:L,D-transpeptidase family protein [Prosthecobacter sp.]|uniref:L,D-transpeptidase n=1 Tax=Prosthecobacter sp. TaxID=1965333 RepID=UPI002ABCC9C5|nr:L,D-transpeptidase family protein [Prosthecobacter sp.]MDZ4401757.1 L,D-transpeptidase family protein [Prosthecobacter sp.]
MIHPSLPCCSRLLATTSFLCLLLCSGCISLPPAPQARYGAPVDDVSHWDGDHLTGSPSVRISLSEQRAYLYKGDQLAGVSLISSGREGLGTVTGSYRILTKEREHRSSLFGAYMDANGEVMQRDVDTRKDPKPPGAIYQGADMPNWMRITGGTGMHAGFLPGYPASHGCIRMPGFMAEHFFHAVAVGTPVRIER